MKERSGREVEPPAPQVGPVYFAETGHNLTGTFLDTWRQGGGLGQFGQR